MHKVITCFFHNNSYTEKSILVANYKSSSFKLVFFLFAETATTIYAMR